MRVITLKRVVMTLMSAALVAVTMPFFAFDVNAASISLSPSSGSVNLGDSVNLSTTVTPSGGTISSVSSYEWKTSDGTVHMPNEIIGNPSESAISFTGTANEAGTFLFTINYIMNDSSTASATYTLTVAGGESGESAAVFVPGPTAEEIRQKEIEAAYEEFVKEGTAPENKTVGGNKSEVNGFYYAKKVNGVAIQPSAGSGADKTSYVVVSDTDKKKSSAAIDVANLAAGTLNGTVGPCINVSYGKIVDGKFVPTTDGSAGNMWIGIPDNFKVAGARYAVVAVYDGGSYKIINNTVSTANPADSGKILASVPKATSPDVMYAVIRY